MGKDMKKCFKFGQVCDGSCTKVENPSITINELKDKNSNLLQQLASKHDEIKLLQESISKQDAIVEENERLLILNDEYKHYNKKLKKKVKKAKAKLTRLMKVYSNGYSILLELVVERLPKE